MKEKKYFGEIKKKVELFFSIVPFLIIPFLIPQISYSEPLSKIIDGLQTYLNNTNDFTASFIQVTQLQSFDEKQTSTGEVYFMKPGKMRWEYQKPELQTIVVNIGQVWIYTPEDNQAIKARIEELNTSVVYNLFLSDKIKINEIFNISTMKRKKSFKKSTIFLELIPKKIEDNIKKIILKLKKSDYQIESFVSYDKMDNIITIKFIDIVRNQGLKASIFNFKLPDGVELITSDDLGA